MSASRTIIAEDDRLTNVHPGDILREDFLVGSEIPLAEVAEKTGIDVDRLANLVASAVPVTADIDIRLGAYLGLSKGYFMRLQNAYDLEEAERSAGDEIGLIRPRIGKAA